MLTPAHHTELEHIVTEVAVVDASQKDVEVEALDGCPGEAAEQQAVQDGAQGCAQSTRDLGSGQHRAQQEGDGQEQHRAVKVHVDVRQGLTLLPVGASTNRRAVQPP